MKAKISSTQIRPLSAAVALLLCGGHASAQQVADAQAANLDTIVVTGTRARNRTALDSTSPIDIVTADDLKAAGAVNGELGQALQTLLPSLNFPRQSNAGGADMVRSAQLRGLSPDQVLVLINGKRVHTSALVQTESTTGLGTTPVDLNAIPISAIKRVEVLRDGAGAQYGSDAIAGVVNIILDDSPHGGEITTSYGAYHTDFEPTKRTITDGQSSFTSAKFGTELGSGVGGFLRGGVEVNNHNATNRAGFDNFAGDSTPDNLKLLGKVNYAAGDPKLENYSGWLNGALPLSDAATLYAFGTYAHRHSTGDNFFRYPDDAANVKSIYPDGYRPVGLGSSDDIQGTAGVRGRLGEWDYDASLTYGDNDFDYRLRNSLNASLGTASPTSFDTGEYEFAQTVANFDATRGVNLGGRDYTLALGAEARHENFQTHAGDPASYAIGPVTGVPIGAQAGTNLTPADTADVSRNVQGVYAELSGNLSDALFVDAAVRYEHYDDFGSTTNGKLSARYEITPQFALRGAVSTNFRAPSLSQIGFESTSTGYDNNGNLIDSRILSVNNPIARALGAKPLQPEKSHNYSIGFTATPAEKFDVSLDIYKIDIDHRVVLSEQIGGDALTEFIASHFGIPGVQAVNFFTNAVDTSTKGADLVANYRLPLYEGTLTLTGSYSYADTHIERVADTPAELVALGNDNVLFGLQSRNILTNAAPRNRGILSARWADSKWSLLGRATRQGSTTRVFDFGGGFTPTQTYAAKWQLDAEVEYKFTPTFSVAVGGINLTDNYPTRSSDDINYFGNLPYDIISPIGFNGAYYYARARLTF
ncbi:TonB-dependent receptor plug domain-containing protein [Rudaea cellulosilytica]|uniref:TonB-dependent receptor plug domain-containing protein n=1 Tax=Rudaea cellulosilytica TaxID=540746 RepID=UPI0003751F93|nr:TonB-dependent receptor [Rudaea cellulosilytica]